VATSVVILLIIVVLPQQMFVKSASKYEKETCVRGLTLLVVWRGSESKSCPNCLEIYIDGALLDRIPSPAFAKDFFIHFFSDDPISPYAKQSFLRGYLSDVLGVQNVT
jgi:hypothetical protein